MPKEKLNTSCTGHRKRLRERYLKTGFEGFSEHEVIEYLLFYVRPREDTKSIAKDLLCKFKNFHGILKADIKELKQVEGIKDISAEFFKSLQSVVEYYYKEKTKNNEIQFLNIDDLVKYLKATIGNKKNEILECFYLNSKNELLKAETLGEGTVTEAVAFPRKIVEGALKNSAASVILAHNHPGGLNEPSENDDQITKNVMEALKIVKINLQEHVILSDNGYYSYRKNGFFD
ncbi:MAG: DNA repair protein RadC [Candidatus Firestonebacteria bacterium]